MANRNSSNKMSSFEEAMRKFEEALRQSQEIASGRGVPGAGQPRRPGQTQPPWGQPPDWASPNGNAGSFEIDDPARPRDIGEGETLEHADWLRRAAEAADTYAVRADAFKDQPPGAGPGEGVPGEGRYSETGQDSRSRLSGLTMVEAVDPGTTSDWWDDSTPYAMRRGRTGSLPPLLAYLDRTRNPLVQGVIWSEVLGRPVSKRRGRGRSGI